MFRLILGFVVTEDMQQLHVVTAFQGILKRQKKLKKMEKVVVYFGMVDNHPKGTVKRSRLFFHHFMY